MHGIFLKRFGKYKWSVNRIKTASLQAEKLNDVCLDFMAKNAKAMKMDAKIKCLSKENLVKFIRSLARINV
jgi:hypothetical protein